MRNRARIVCMVLLAAAALGSNPRIGAAQVRRAKPSEIRRAGVAEVIPKDTVAAPVFIPAPLAAKLSAASSRDVMMRSLLGNPETKASLEAKGLTTDQLLSGTKALPKTASQPSIAQRLQRVVSKASETGRLPDANQEAFDQVKWDEGVTFIPLSIPTYGAPSYKLGAYYIRYAQMQSWQPDVLCLMPPYVASTWSGTVFLYLELPVDPAMYMIAVKLTIANGTCPASFVLPQGSKPAAIYITVDGASQQPQFTPLLDGTGYVGLFGIDQPIVNPGSAYGMRQRTATVMISVSLAEAPDFTGYLIFGGITITRV